MSIVRATAPAWRRSACDVLTERLAPVDMLPQTRLRRRFSCGGANSPFTLLQSHSSSSATSIASAVNAPWPISDLAMRMITVSSGWITTQAVISGALCEARAPANGMAKPSVSAPPVAATLARNARRSMYRLPLMAGAPSPPPAPRPRRCLHQQA